MSALANKNIHSLTWLQRDVAVTILEYLNDEVCVSDPYSSGEEHNIPRSDLTSL